MMIGGVSFQSGIPRNKILTNHIPFVTMGQFFAPNGYHAISVHALLKPYLRTANGDFRARGCSRVDVCGSSGPRSSGGVLEADLYPLRNGGCRIFRSLRSRKDL